jgi:hypothetical protein
MYKFIILSSLIHFNVFNQNIHKDTIIHSDFCCDIIDTNVLIVKRKIAVYQIPDSLYNLLEKKIHDCFPKRKNIFSCYNFSLSEATSNTYIVSIEVDYPIEENDNINGVFFVSSVPFFINQKEIENSNVFELLDSVVVVRNKIRSEYFSCIKTESSYSNEKFSLDEMFYYLFIENCYNNDIEKKKKPHNRKRLIKKSKT